MAISWIVRKKTRAQLEMSRGGKEDEKNTHKPSPSRLKWRNSLLSLSLEDFDKNKKYSL